MKIRWTKAMIIFFITFVMISFGYMGWIYGLNYQIVRDYSDTVDYKHWKLEQQSDYKYCPYCGEKLKENK